MKIVCKKCSRYLGEIRDATLHKQIVYLCDKCETQRVSLEMRYNSSSTSDYSKKAFDDLFNGFNFKK